MKKALITGANKSIGFETARQLLQKGYYVYLGSRNFENGQEAVEKLKVEGLNEVEAIRIDVSDDESVKAARAEIGKKTESLDVLINNAGILGGMQQTATDTNIDVFKEVFDTNLFGVVRVTQAFMDLLRKSPEPRIVNVTSGLASLTLHNDPAWKYYSVKAAVYNSSKAALNMYTVVLAYELRNTPFKVNAVDPGYTATDFNHQSGPGTVEEAGARLVKYATIDSDGPTGKFLLMTTARKREKARGSFTRLATNFQRSKTTAFRRALRKVADTRTLGRYRKRIWTDAQRIEVSGEMML